MTEQTISVLNLDCIACETRVDRALTSLPGVETATSSCITETVTVRYDEQHVSQEDLRRCVRRAGCALPGDGVPPAPRRTALLRNFLTAALLTLPLLWPLPVWMQMGFSGLLFLWPGRIALQKPWRADTLILLAACLLWGCGVWRACNGLSARLFFLGVGAVLTGLLLGRYLEAAVQYRAMEPVRRLLRLQPKTARTEHAGETDIDSLQIGDVVLLCPGERIPADGTLLEGSITVDESALTDLPGLVEKHPGETLLAGTLNRAGSGKLTVTALGENTVLRQKVEQLRSRRK